MEIGDAENQKKIFLEWKDNMKDKYGPTIQEYVKSNISVITFFPDLGRLCKITKLNDDIISSFRYKIHEFA